MSEPRKASPPEFRSGDEDIRWVHAHLKDELRPYQGQWIAVIDKRVVAAGSSVMQLLEEVAERGLTQPFVTQVPDDVDRETIFIG